MTRTSSLTEETVAGGPSRAEKATSSQETPSQRQDLPEKVDEDDIQGAQHRRNRDFGIIPIPTHLRYNPAKPFHFGMVLNIAFGLISTFSVFLPICVLKR